MLSSRRPKAVAVLAGLGVTAGLTAASAASLGGVTAQSLGADVQTVASCDTDGVAVAYSNAYDTATGRYLTNGVTVSGIAPLCVGKNISVTLKNATSASLGAGTIVVAGATQTIVIAPGADASLVTGVAIAIAG
jgi:hypothetical protein